jgi:hypothetical protein
VEIEPLDVLRFVWTFGTGLGSLIMLYLMREVAADERALQMINRSGLNLMRLLAHGETTDQRIRFISLVALFIGGATSYLRMTELVIVCLVVSAAAQIYLGWIKVQRRRQVFRQIRLQRGGEEAYGN